MERVSIKPGKIVGGKVYINQFERWIEATDVIPACAGEADSIGFIIIGEEQARYITDTQVDAAFLLQQAKEIVSQLTQLTNQAIAITQAQFIIGADNAQWGVNDNLTPIGEIMAGLVDAQAEIANVLGKHRLI